MPYLIGTDEAGYGPNLGPLVVSATLWQVPPHAASGELYEMLGDDVTESPRASDRRLALADSKLLYQAGGSLAPLERGVLAALSQVGHAASSWRALCAALDPAAALALDELPWYATYDGALPVSLPADEVAAAGARFSAALSAAGVRLMAVRSTIVLPPAFNTQVARCDSKGTLLSGVTLDLVAQLLDLCASEPVLVICDKHGGRNKYGPLLQNRFPDSFIEIRGEARSESTYRFGPPERRVQIVFRAKGESFLPAALASMTCKYVRELAMQAENRFWQQHVPGLRPTAGYPEDARRFKSEIAAQQAALQIADHLLWRSR